MTQKEKIDYVVKRLEEEFLALSPKELNNAKAYVVLYSHLLSLDALIDQLATNLRRSRFQPDNNLPPNP